MWMIEKLVALITFPIQWFWAKYTHYQEEENILKIIILFTLSLSGVAIIGIATIYIIVFVFQNYPEWVVVGGLVVWLYAYIHTKMEQKAQMSAMQNAEQTMMLTQQQIQMQDQAINAYPVIRNILYQTLKDVAESIGGVVPRLLAEIEVPERHFIFANGICFYQFKLAKADIKFNYMREELQEFQRITQAKISQKIQCGEFPTLGASTFLDTHGNIYDAVCIDIIEDMNTYLIIQAVFYSPTYAEYLRYKQINMQSWENGTSIPEETWRNTP